MDRDELYNFNIDHAIDYVVCAKGNTQTNPILMRVPVAGSMSVNPFKIQFNEDPRHMGMEIVDLYASDIARVAKNRARQVKELQRDILNVTKKLQEAEIEILKHREIVARYEILTSIQAEDMMEKYDASIRETSQDL